MLGGALANATVTAVPAVASSSLYCAPSPDGASSMLVVEAVMRDPGNYNITVALARAHTVAEVTGLKVPPALHHLNFAFSVSSQCIQAVCQTSEHESAGVPP